ncbi:response regulator [Lactobacillus sp. YT155]|uniref:response regulator n=1 Tax=Lactobacillus sp. YT155 TaxID=3060955 RepID=UPI00265F5874|nr:response regulator [Lactobacillus sp. YT155]MDO1604736.1 response regulator [Lactobacillus sp. YT155]
MKIKILVVEDDPMVSEINQSYLQRTIDDTQLEISVAKDGSAALKEITKQDFDLILLDVYMPKLNGDKLLKELLELKKHPQIIMLTAANESKHLQSAVEYGVLDYLVKPFTFERFQQAIEKFLKTQQSLNDNKVFSQEKIDSLFQNTNEIKKDNHDLPKGLSELSLQKIKKEISKEEGLFSVQDLARKTQLSRISVKKYIDYLLDQDEIQSEIKYLEIGRPLTVYKKKL